MCIFADRFARTRKAEAMVFQYLAYLAVGNSNCFCRPYSINHFKCLQTDMVIVTVELGETVADNRFVHINSEGLAIIATSTNPAVGFVRFGGDASDIVQVFLSGLIDAPFEGLSGQVAYLSASGLASATPSSQKLGVLVENGRMLLNIDPKVESSAGGGVALAATFFKI